MNQADSQVIRGNLLTLPVGGGLLYVQPVYVQGTGSASYPVLRSVLTAFGNQVGFAPTLEESLDQTFGGDSAATVANNAGGETAEGDDTSNTVTQTAQQRLNQALTDASAAMQAGQTALSSGDWSAYGESQKKLNDALARALAAQEELGQSTGVASGSTDTPQSGSTLGSPGADATQSNG